MEILVREPLWSRTKALGQLGWFVQKTSEPEFLYSGEVSPAVKAAGCEPNHCHHRWARAPVLTRPILRPTRSDGDAGRQSEHLRGCHPRGVSGPRSPAGVSRSGGLRTGARVACTPRLSPCGWPNDRLAQLPHSLIPSGTGTEDANLSVFIIF